MLKTVTGQDALGFVVALQNYRYVKSVREFVCGIDVDNAGRSYEHEYRTSIPELNWTILNYLSGTKAEVSQYFSAEIDDEGWPVTFTIHTELDDCESSGIRYEFAYE